jgi:hypothetical protein
MDSLDLSLDPSFCDNSWCFPQPMSVCRSYPSGMVFSSQAELDPEGLCWFKRGDNHLQVYRAQCLLNRYISGHFGPEWLGSDGYRWPLLLEDGLLNLDTESALKQFQEGLDVPLRGCLCPKTRALLPPLLRFHGSLTRKRLKVPQLRWPPKYSTRGSGTRSGSSGSSYQSNKGADDSDTPPAPAGTTGPAAGKKVDDEDKPWTLKITPNWGFGGSGPLWTGKSSTGASVTPDKLEVDQKAEVDLSLLTSWALGKGKLKFVIGAEYDSPVDNVHHGKSTLAGNFQLQADNLLKNDYVSLSPYLKYSPQVQRNGDGWKESNAFKVGLEFDADLQKIFKLSDTFKGLKLEADVNGGIQTPGPGNDPATTPKMILPVEGAINFSWDLPLHSF